MMMGASSNVNGPIAETAHRYVAQKQLAISEDLYLHGSIDGAHKNINEMIGRYQNKQQMSLTDGRRAARYRRKRVYVDDRIKISVKSKFQECSIEETVNPKKEQYIQSREPRD